MEAWSSVSKLTLYGTDSAETKAVSNAYSNMPKNTQVATTMPITPIIFGPIACISSELLAFASWPSFGTTRADAGIAETAAVAEPAKTITPRNKIDNVSVQRTASATQPRMADRANTPRSVITRKLLDCSSKIALAETCHLATNLFGSEPTKRH